MVSRMEHEAQYSASVRPRWRSKARRKQIMPPKNKFNYNNNNPNYVSKQPNYANYVSKQTNNNYVSKQPNNGSNPPNNNLTRPSNNINMSSNNVTKPSNNAIRPSKNDTLPRADPQTSEQTLPGIDNVQIKQERFDFDEGFILNIKQEKPDNGYENVTKWVDAVNLNLNIKQEKVDPSYEVGQKRKCSTTNKGNSKKPKCHS